MNKITKSILLSLIVGLLFSTVPIDARRRCHRKRPRVCCRAPQGDPGSQGPQGLPGIAGAAGIAGVTGAQGIPGIPGGPGQAFNNFVFSYSTVSNETTAINVFADITFDVDGQLLGWSRPSFTSFLANETGTYLIEYAGTVVSTNTSSANVVLRATLNGSEILGSQIGVEVIGSQGRTIAKSIIANVTAGDVLTLQFTTTNQPTLVFLAPVGAGIVPTSAAISISRIN